MHRADRRGVNVGIKPSQPFPYLRRRPMRPFLLAGVGGDVRDGLKWYVHNADKPAMDQSSGRGPALSLAPRERWCYQHVQAIIVVLDAYSHLSSGMHYGAITPTLSQRPSAS
jgi:hypothetical protein